MHAAGVEDTRGDADAATSARDDRAHRDGTDLGHSSADESETAASEPAAHAPDEDEDAAGAAPKTKNELGDDQVAMPAITHIAPEELALLQPIGRINSVVDSVVLVAQDVCADPAAGNQEAPPTECDVLDSGSLLCLEGGRVLGFVYETFGSVHAPMYSVRFSSADDVDRVRIVPGMRVCFLPGSSTLVTTKAIRTKGSDASNIWDEEIAVDEAEYSDDEEEANAKRRAKQARRGQAPSPPRSSTGDVDPATASLGPLGGAPEPAAPPRGPPRKRRERQRRSHEPRAWHPGDAGNGLPKRPRVQEGAAGGVSAPHINPRFAQQWMRAGSGSVQFPIPLRPPPYATGTPAFPPAPFPLPSAAMPGFPGYLGYQGDAPRSPLPGGAIPYASAYDPHTPSLQRQRRDDEYTP
ncbi:hypothetical protein MSPP1_003429 [Malassezia sp. CBS 17886]|nr:hypothetical protein MSPP1_003429 [Malassezia sp. CBS 17886]